jgi:hypothetical protein
MYRSAFTGGLPDILSSIVQSRHGAQLSLCLTARPGRLDFCLCVLESHLVPILAQLVQTSHCLSWADEVE